MPDDNKQTKSFWAKLFSGSSWALFTMFVWQIVEECLEDLIVYAISSAFALFITKVLSTFAIITVTQGIKVSIKRFLMPLVKTLTYKEGFDKMSKLKTFFTWIWCNKKTLTGICSSAIITLSGSGVIDVNTLPALNIGSFNATPLFYYLLLAALTLIGTTGKGFEAIQTFFSRKKVEASVKEEKAIEKEAKKEIENEKKLANQTQAEQEKARIKAENEAKAKEEKAKADAEYRAKVEAVKAKLLADQNAENAENKTN